jgi:hypothetical protein
LSQIANSREQRQRAKSRERRQRAKSREKRVKEDRKAERRIQGAGSKEQGEKSKGRQES